MASFAFASSRSWPRMAVSASTVIDLGLHFEDAAGDEDQFFLAAAGFWMRTAPGLMRVMSGVWRG